jgi:hypothetical protein
MSAWSSCDDADTGKPGVGATIAGTSRVVPAPGALQEAQTISLPLTNQDVDVGLGCEC